VVGIGSMVMDRVHRAPRILAGEEKGILRDVAGAGPVAEFIGGVVLNHLGWAAALGLRVGVFGKQADDQGGRRLRAAMDRLGIERHLVLDGSASSVAEIFVDDAGSRAIYMAPGATSETDALHVRECHADFIRRAARLSTEVSQLPLDATLEALRIAREAGIPTTVDLDVPPSDALATLGDEKTLLEVLHSADLLKPAKAAAQELAEDAAPDALALARSMRRRFGNRAVVVTDGEAGCAISARDFDGAIAGLALEAVDTTGAGDAFLGGLLAGLDLGLGWERAARLANCCGAACVEQLGAFPDDPLRARARVLELYGDDALPLGAPPSAAAPAARPAEAALAVLEVGASELAALSRRHDGRAFDLALDLLESSRQRGGRVHVTGVGKPEHVARYGASLLCSTGTPATFLHATEALHGSLGQVMPGDVVIAISNSGATQEIQRCVEALRSHGVGVIGVTGELDSWLARNAEVALDSGTSREGGPLELAPRASVAAQVLVLAALGAGLQQRSGFTREDYAVRHPAGALGRRARD
jgi:arabinose-5-phosphate isomerase